MMELQYLSDQQGRHTAVVIPIEEWNNLTIRHQDLKMLEHPQKNKIKRKPSDFVGIISKEVAYKMIEDISNSRNEWEPSF